MSSVAYTLDLTLVDHGGGLSSGTPVFRLGFFAAAPVVQPAGTPAAATDLASVVALANSLKASLVSLGLVT